MVKRMFDILISSFTLALLSPLLCLLAVAVYFTIGSPVLFRQLRPGLNGAPFEIVKFKSMRETHDDTGAALPDEQRLTPFGTLLRATSLDELPELWNVLKGDMSLVGPRPLCMEYLPLYDDEQARRHSVRPGITGWAQVNGRNRISWQRKFELDVWYVDNHTFLLDMRIILLTVKSVLNRSGISSETHATMEDFKGN